MPERVSGRFSGLWDQEQSGITCDLLNQIQTSQKNTAPNEVTSKEEGLPSEQSDPCEQARGTARGAGKGIH